MISKLLALVLVVGAAAAAPPPSAVGHMRTLRDTAAHAMSRAEGGQVEVNGTNYTTYAGCVGAANDELARQAQAAAQFMELYADYFTPEQLAERNTIQASLDTW